MSEGQIAQANVKQRRQPASDIGNTGKYLRRGFDRNLQAIDQAVYEYTNTLEQNPEDELSGEMLDSVLNEKVNLLREFSEL